MKSLNFDLSEQMFFFEMVIISNLKRAVHSLTESRDFRVMNNFQIAPKEGNFNSGIHVFVKYCIEANSSYSQEVGNPLGFGCLLCIKLH